MGRVQQLIHPSAKDPGVKGKGRGRATKPPNIGVLIILPVWAAGR